MAWIELHQTLPTNKKTIKFKNALKIKTPQAIGHLCLLWLWALDNAPDGDLSKLTPSEVAEIAMWTGKNKKSFSDALMVAGFVNEDSHLHDWHEYAGKLIDRRAEQREQARSRKQKQREKAREVKESHENVTRDMRDKNVTVTPLPYPTVPYRTEPNNKLVVVDDTRVRAQAQEAVDKFVENRDLSLDVYFGVDDQVKAEVTGTANAIFKKFSLRKPTEQDVFYVFQSVRISKPKESGQGYAEWEVSLDKDRLDLLMYAFEKATAAGAAGNWNYINGVLAKLSQRGIKTLSEAEDYDGSRAEHKERT